MAPSAFTPVAEIFSIDGCNDRVRQTHDLDGLSHLLRLGLIYSWRRSPRSYGTKPTSSGADVSQNHEGRGTVLTPALVDIGTARLFTHGIEIEPLHQTPDLMVPLGSRQTDLQPIGLGLEPSAGPCTADFDQSLAHGE